MRTVAQDRVRMVQERPLLVSRVPYLFKWSLVVWPVSLSVLSIFFPGHPSVQPSTLVSNVRKEEEGQEQDVPLPLRVPLDQWQATPADSCVFGPSPERESRLQVLAARIEKERA